MGRKPVLSAYSLSVLGLTLFVFAGIITVLTFAFRGDLRRQIIDADASLLYPVAITQLSHTLEDFGNYDDPDFLEANILAASLSTVNLPGVLALRVYRQDGSIFDEVPIGYDASPLDKSALASLSTLNPISYYLPEGSLRTFINPAFPYQNGSPRPLLVIALPLHERHSATVLGYAEFIMDGHSVQARLRALDNRLLRQAISIFLIGGSVVSISLLLAFYKLHRANRLLAERSRSLLAANHELLMRSKLNAIGAITAHLIHGIKNPLAGLSHYIADKSNTPSCDTPQDAVATASRAQALINEVVSILREEESGDRFSFTIGELAEIASSKIAEHAKQKCIHFQIHSQCNSLEIDSRIGNLTLLILHNLLQNALEATPAEGSITLSFSRVNESVVVDVADTGLGLTETMRENPFAPRQSTKPDGGGIGLAICAQLAQAMQATLSLVHTSAQGTTFRLYLPQDSSTASSAAE